MTREDRLAVLLEKWEASTASGGSHTPDEMCQTCPELLDDFKRLLNALELLPLAADEQTADADDEKTVDGLDGGRYRPVQYHARGGLGIVYVAQDQELHREVALKFMQRLPATDSISRQRFLQEAEITGKLEHPGIVPIYGLGIDPDGKPYYAMRFIRGMNLDAAINDYHQKKDANSDGNVSFRKLLRHFISVCETIAYAHSRGVIHRDIKPANVMIGPYGETMVLDWGIAKHLSDEDTAESDTGLGPIRLMQAGATATMTGQAKGSPAYMSPEQALGEWKRVGPASDVYSLGSTLYVLLTGRKPFEGQSGREVVAKVKTGEFPSPRSVHSATSAALEAVCLKAMRRPPEDRYPDARAMAADLERWLADEPVSVYREPFRDRARRWSRKHRSLVTGISALMVTAVVGLIIGLFAVNGERRKTQVALDQVREEQVKTQKALSAESLALGQVREEQVKTQKALDAETFALGQVRLAQEKTEKALVAETLALDKSKRSEKTATEQRQLAMETMKRIVIKIDGRLKGVPALQDLRKEILNEAGAGLKEVARAADTATEIDHQTIVVYFEIGDILLDLEGSVRDAEAMFNKAHQIALRLDAEDGSDKSAHDLSCCYDKLAEVRLKMGDPKGAREVLEKTIAINDRLEAKRRRETKFEVIHSQHNLIVGRFKLCEALKLLGETERAFEQAKEAYRLAGEPPIHPSKEAELLRNRTITGNQVGVFYLKRGDLKAAHEAFNTALEARKRLCADAPEDLNLQRDLSISYERVGEVAYQANDLKSAESWFTRSLEIRQKLADLDKANVSSQRDLMVTHSLLGKLQRQRANLPASLKSYSECIDIARRLAAIDRNNLSAQWDLAVSLNNRASAVHNADADNALLDYREAFDIADALVKAEPANVDFQTKLAETASGIATLSNMKNQPTEALKLLNRAVGCWQAMTDRDPDHLEFPRGLSGALNNRAQAHLRAGDLKAADADHRESVRLADEVYKRDPNTLASREALALALFEWGYFLEQTGETKEAAACFKRHVEVCRLMAKDRANDLGKMHDLLRGLYRYAYLSLDLNDRATALAANNEAMEQVASIDIERVPLGMRRTWLSNVGMQGDLLFAARKYPEALESFEKALRMTRLTVKQGGSNAVEYQRDLSISLGKVAKGMNAVGRNDDALALIDESAVIARDLAKRFPNHADIHDSLAIAVYNTAYYRDGMLRIEEAHKCFLATLEVLEDIERRKLIINPRQFQSMLQIVKKRIAMLQGVQKALKGLDAVDADREAIQSNILTYLLDVHLKVKAHAKVVEVAERLAKLGKPNAFYVASYATVQCIFHTDDENLRKRYADRSVELLERAIAAGYNNLANIKNTRAFDAVRQREDFKKIIAGLEKQVPK